MITIKTKNPETKITIQKAEHKNPEKLIKKINNIQLIDAKNIKTYKEIIHSAILAKKSIKNNTNIAEDPYIETILYLSKQRQIKKAIQKHGVNKKTKKFYTITFNGEKHLKKFIKQNNIKKLKTETKTNPKNLKKNLEKTAMLKVK